MTSGSPQSSTNARKVRMPAKVIIWRGAILFTILLMIWRASTFRWIALLPSVNLLVEGLVTSIWLSLASMIIGALIAVPLAVIRVYGPWGAKHLAIAVVEIVRATPELMVIFWAFFGLPMITGYAIDGWTAALSALIIIASAYLAEVFRAGLYSVNDGQWEAGAASGLSKWHVFSRVILPQAIANMAPALLGQVVMLFKTTSLVYIVGIMEFFKAAQIVNANVYAPYEIYTLIALVYFIICGVLSAIVRRIDPKHTLID